MHKRPVIAALIALAIVFPSEIRSQPAAESDRAGCELPKPSDNAKVIMFSSENGEALSTSTIGLQHITVETGVVTIEPGSEPLYIVGLSGGAMIWRLQGDVGRVERLVLSSNTSERRDSRGLPLVGATGIAPERVAFLKRADCLKFFVDSPSVAAAVATAEVRRQTGKEPVVVAAGRFTVSEYGLPSGTMRTEWNKDPQADVDQRDYLALVAASTYPSGIVDIDPATVIASMPAEYYRVLPGISGLLQLVRSGALQRTKSGDFIIKKKTYFPGALTGGDAATFLLPRGVPAPEGDPGQSCVFSEETGEFSGNEQCRRRRM